jgi:hypothetical protein
MTNAPRRRARDSGVNGGVFKNYIIKSFILRFSSFLFANFLPLFLFLTHK